MGLKNKSKEGDIKNIIKDEDIEHGYTEHEDIKHEDIKHEDIENGDIENGDTKHEYIEDEDIEHEDTEHEDIEHEDIKHEDIKHEDIENGDTKHEDIEDEDIKHEDIENGDIENGDTKHEYIEHEDIEHEDTENGDIENGDTKHEDIEHEDIEHEDIKHEDTEHEDIEHEDTEHGDTVLKEEDSTVSINERMHTINNGSQSYSLFSIFSCCEYPGNGIEGSDEIDVNSIISENEIETEMKKEKERFLKKKSFSSPENGIPKIGQINSKEDLIKQKLIEFNIQNLEKELKEKNLKKKLKKLKKQEKKFSKSLFVYSNPLDISLEFGSLNLYNGGNIFVNRADLPDEQNIEQNVNTYQYFPSSSSSSSENRENKKKSSFRDKYTLFCVIFVSEIKHLKFINRIVRFDTPGCTEETLPIENEDPITDYFILDGPSLLKEYYMSFASNESLVINKIEESIKGKVIFSLEKKNFIKKRVKGLSGTVVFKVVRL